MPRRTSGSAGPSWAGPSRRLAVSALPYRDQPPPPLPAPPPLPPIERDPRAGWPALPPAAELDEPRPPVLFVIGMPVRLADFMWRERASAGVVVCVTTKDDRARAHAPRRSFFTADLQFSRYWITRGRSMVSASSPPPPPVPKLVGQGGPSHEKSRLAGPAGTEEIDAESAAPATVFDPHNGLQQDNSILKTSV